MVASLAQKIFNQQNNMPPNWQEGSDIKKIETDVTAPSASFRRNLVGKMLELDFSLSNRPACRILLK